MTCVLCLGFRAKTNVQLASVCNEDGFSFLKSLNKPLVCTDDGNILDESLHIIKNNTGALLVAGKRFDYK
jgi:hypothetical protein